MFNKLIKLSINTDTAKALLKAKGYDLPNDISDTSLLVLIMLQLADYGVSYDIISNND